MKLLSLSKNSPATTTTTTTLTTTLARTSSWPWHGYCHQPQTRSFRGGSDDLFRTVNSSFLEDLESPPEEEEEEDESIEKVIRGARLEGRIVFEPAGETSSVLAAEAEEEEDGESGEHAQDSELAEAGVATCVVVDSHDPYRDFRASMEEMVEANALGGKWDSLEDLLQCYLRVNDRSNYASILRAFVDLLLTSVDSQRSLSFADAPSCSCNCNRHTPDDPNDINSNPPTTSSPCSPLSFYTSSSSCCSSSDSLSTTPFCISVTDESQENSDGKQCVPFAKAEDQKNREGDHNSPSSSTSSSSSDV